MRQRKEQESGYKIENNNMFKKKVKQEQYLRNLRQIAVNMGSVLEKDGVDQNIVNKRIQNITLANKIDAILDHLNLEYYEEEKSGLREKK